MKSLFYLAIAVIFGSCAMQNKPKTLDAKLISYESSGCFGKCAEEELTISKKLEMRYVGTENVSNIGSFGSVISEEDYNNLLNQFEKTKFESMDSTYLSGVKDIQKFTISVDGKSVTFHERSASEDLQSLKNTLKLIISKYDWKE